MRGQSTEGRLFVLPHEAAVSEHIGAKYGVELTLHDLTLGRSFRPVWMVVKSLKTGVNVRVSPERERVLMLSNFRSARTRGTHPPRLDYARTMRVAAVSYCTKRLLTDGPL